MWPKVKEIDTKYSNNVKILIVLYGIYHTINFPSIYVQNIFLFSKRFSSQIVNFYFPYLPHKYAADFQLLLLLWVLYNSVFRNI